MSNYRTATHEEYEELKKEALQWHAECGGWFSDTQATALLSVMEYLAWKRGLTIYDERLALSDNLVRRVMR